MALTREGKALTEAHRLEQLRISLEANDEVNKLWPLLKMSDLDRSTPYWTARMLRVMGAHYKDSQDAAARYVESYREAEIGTGSGIVVKPDFNALAATVTLRIHGPVALKQKVAKGFSPDAAHLAGRDTAQYVAQQAILGGGRNLIDNTARADGRTGRYRRVTDGQPCSFCAMLVSRGPVYSVETAYFRSHFKCGCTAEIVYGEWKPTPLESKWIDSYNKAAEAADGAGQSRIAPTPGRQEDNILWRMRRNSPSLFSDGVVPPKPKP